MSPREDYHLDPEQRDDWREYLKYFREEIYPLFEEQGVSFDAALTTWFVNRLRNVIPDDDSDNEVWKQ